jgi:hypothetical protein
MPPVITLKMNTNIKASVRDSAQQAVINDIWKPMRYCLFNSAQGVAVQSVWRTSMQKYFTIFIHHSVQNYFKQK